MLSIPRNPIEVPFEWFSEEEKRRARYLLSLAVQRGEIVPPEVCDHCGKNRNRRNGKRHSGIEAHHPDYSRPLYVMWLCKLCHADVHHRGGFMVKGKFSQAY